MDNRALTNAIAIGTILLQTSMQYPLRLSNVLFVPGLRHNLIAVSKLNSNYKITFV